MHHEVARAAAASESAGQRARVQIGGEADGAFARDAAKQLVARIVTGAGHAERVASDDGKRRDTLAPTDDDRAGYDLASDVESAPAQM